MNQQYNPLPRHESQDSKIDVRINNTRDKRRKGSNVLSDDLSSNNQSSDTKGPLVVSETQKILAAMPKKLTQHEILTAKLNAITFEDINRMDYNKLVQGANDSDRFDPKKLLDLDSDEEEDGNVTPQLLKSPKKSQLPPRH